MQRVCLRRMDREVDNKEQSTQKSGAANKGPNCQHRGRTKVTMSYASARTESDRGFGGYKNAKPRSRNRKRCCTASARDDAGTCARGRVTGQNGRWGTNMNAMRTHRHKATRAWAPGEGKEGLAPQTEARNIHTHGRLGKEEGKDKPRANGTPQMAHTARERAAKGESREGHEGTNAGNRDLHTRRAQHRQASAAQRQKLTTLRPRHGRWTRTQMNEEGSAGAQLSAARATRGNRHQARKSNAAAGKSAQETQMQTTSGHRQDTEQEPQDARSVGRRPWRQAWDGRKDSHKKNKAAEPQHQTKWHDETQCAPRVGNKKQKSKTQREEKPGIADAR
ncbi:hypothetical protein ERJ75_000691100 [Trypanosoma vivax]|nr:hypothetical protein ERJ75_000691100 [Trypanosoma vivax]